MYGRPVDDDEYDETKWHLCATASGEPATPRGPEIPLQAPPEESEELVDDEFYQRLASESDVVYGSAFRGLKSARRIGPDELWRESACRRISRTTPRDTGSIRRSWTPRSTPPLLSMRSMEQVRTARSTCRSDGGHCGGRGYSELRVRVKRTRDSATAHLRLDFELWDREGHPVGRLIDVEPGRRIARRSSGQPRRPLETCTTSRGTRSNRRILLGSRGRGNWSPRTAIATQWRSRTRCRPPGPRSSWWLPHCSCQAQPSASCTSGLLEMLPMFLAPHTRSPGRGSLSCRPSYRRGLGSAETVWITRQAMPAWPGDSASPPCHAGLWGLGRTARSEHPEIGLRLLDLPGGSLDAVAVAAAIGRRHEPELILRDGRMFAPRLVRAVVTDDPQVVDPVPCDGATMVTGGLGGLGHLVALWLAKRGVPHLLLLSRRGSAAADPSALAEIEALGATAQVVACDVSDPAALAAAVASLPVGVRLRGVVHCAGFVDDDLLQAQTPEGFQRVMMPKVWGAWNLHELSLAHPVEAFVLYSSVAGVIGSPGQSNYAAANVFLDSLAHYRRAIGLPAVSLAWGVWRGEAAAQVADLDRLARQGFDALTPERGMSLFECALSRTQARQIPWALRLGRVSRWIASEGVVPRCGGTWCGRGARPAATPDRICEKSRTIPAEARRDRLLVIVRDQIATSSASPRATTSAST